MTRTAINWLLAFLLLAAFLFLCSLIDENDHVGDCDAPLRVWEHRIRVVVADGRTVRSCYA